MVTRLTQECVCMCLERSFFMQEMKHIIREHKCSFPEFQQQMIENLHHTCDSSSDVQSPASPDENEKLN